MPWACGIFPNQGVEPMPPEVEAQVLATGRQEVPVNMYFNERVFIFNLIFLNCDWFHCRNHMFWKNSEMKENSLLECGGIYNDMTVLDFLTGVLLIRK